MPEPEISDVPTEPTEPLFRHHGFTGIKRLSVSLVLLSMLIMPANARVYVKFQDPGSFTDSAEISGIRHGLIYTLRTLGDILNDYGEGHLLPGESLELTVLDVDLAGTPTLSGTRQVTDTTAPRFRIAYRLRQAGRVVLSGTDEIADPIYLMTQNPRGSTGGLYYERGVLREWLRRRFARDQAVR